MARHIVASTSEIPPGGNKVVDVEVRDIVVFRVNGEFFALLNRCRTKARRWRKRRAWRG
jgi:nitrite reductase/ring-hydroxylating ferredoxin subunit